MKQNDTVKETILKAIAYFLDELAKIEPEDAATNEAIDAVNKCIDKHEESDSND